MKEKYAEVLLFKCLNIRKNQPLLINYSTCHKEFAQILKKVAKKYGISDIREIENNPKINRTILINSTIDEIYDNDLFERKIINQTFLDGGCMIQLYSTQPNHYKDIDKDKVSAMNKKIRDSHGEDCLKAISTYRFPYCIAATPTKEWAELIFPNDKDNLEKLWKIFLEVVIFNNENHLKKWTENIKLNNERKLLLNNLKIKLLKYKNSLGTDLLIGLPKNAIWLGTEKESCNGKKIIVNMPTYEVFTSPNKNITSGVVVSSRPLLLNGTKIEQFKLIFKDGKIINIEASNDLEVLKNIIENIDGMDYLGECALVDDSSPISRTNMIFNNNLLDENASCHLALGKAYPLCVKNGRQFTNSELIQNGLNISSMHVDFMIGNEDLSIIATDIYGNDIQIFKDGNFQREEIKDFLLTKRKKF